MDISTYNSASWRSLPWKIFEEKTLNFQCRIYSAVSKGQIKKAIKLQKLLINNISTYFIAVREVTELNIKKKKVEIETTSHIYSEDRFKIVLRVSTQIEIWKHNNLKKIKKAKLKCFENYLETADVNDKIVQYVWKLALEPAQEYLLPNNLYGFRSCNNNLNIQKSIINYLIKSNKIEQKKILKITLSTKFDETDYKIIIKKLIFPAKYKNGIFKALKLGILEDNVFNVSHSQIKISIAPLLANVALYGVLDPYKYICESDNVHNRDQTNFSLKYTNLVLFIIKTNQNEKDIVRKIDELKKRNKITAQTVNFDITEFTNGFDFLDWKFVIKKNGKVISYPCRANWINYKNKIKQTLKSPRYNIEKRIQILKNLSKNWNHYHRYSHMSKMSAQLYYLKTWYSLYIRKNTKMIKEKRIDTLKEIFDTYKYRREKTQKNSEYLYTSLFEKAIT